ncbi:hypothetical protein LTR86_010207 [Recurvomyces mirabilis]|nr:hypothetical protein LTR86_010207 [Recurvomyces mirabilis]
MQYLKSVLPALLVAGTLVDATTYTRSATGNSSFGYDVNSFYLNGQPFQMLGGQMDPQRIPREYWSDRLLKAKAMGLNTIFSYIYWNELETAPGQWDWNGISGMNDIGAWYQEIQNAGLQAVLRPGPYVCGERDWGGFPAWLSQVPNITVRTNNPQFLMLSGYYLGNLSQHIQQYQVTKGGPILMAQVENEYGSFSNDHDYTAALSAIIAKHFDIVQYTNDGGADPPNIVNGAVPGILGEIDGDPYAGFTNLEKYVQNSSRGPKLDGEYYTNWLTTWGPNATYPYLSGIGYNDSQNIAGLKYILDQGGSFSLYMFHGGSNFAFGNGGLNFGQLEAVTPSYDYAAPLNESGRPRDFYWQLRDFLLPYQNGSVPEYPETQPMLETDDIVLKPMAGMFDDLPAATFSGWPLSMEQLGQGRGYTLYRYTSPSTHTGLLKVGDGPRDRVIAYVNDTMKGVIDNVYVYPQNISLSLHAGDVLSLLVENQGRVDFSTPLYDQRKGIVGDVYIGTAMLAPWSMYALPIPSPPANLNSTAITNTSLTISNSSSPTWYTGSFSLPSSICGTAAADTYLTINGGTKGVLYVNGYNLGRYWSVGPQQSQYVPGVWLTERNEVVVLELEPRGQQELVVRGSGERAWFNRVDMDCVGCVSANPN